MVATALELSRRARPVAARSNAPCAKIAYTSKHDACVAIERIIKSHRAKKLSAYKCPHCEQWHLSHQKRKIGSKSKKQLLAGRLAD